MKKQKRWLLRLIKDANVVMMGLTMILVWVVLYDQQTRMGVPLQTELLMLLIISTLYVLFGRIYDAFLIDLERIHHMVYSQMLAAVITDAFAFIILWTVMGDVPNLLRFLLLIPLQMGVSTLWSVLAHRWYFKHYARKRSLIIARDRDEAQQLIQYSGFTKKFKVEDILSTDEMMQLSEAEIQGIDAVFLLKTDNAWAVMQRCALHSIRVYRIPLISEIIASCSTTVTMFYTPMLRMDGYDPDSLYVPIKRCMDLAIVGIAMPIVLPIMLVVAAAIKLDDGGPVFYRQERLTQGGRHFNILKFRSMRVNAESDGVARMSTGANDDRITRVGRVIRALRLDELPQLLNILKGDMSIVGPRPERPELTEEYAKTLPEFRLRLLAKAGLTGYAQVYGKYNTTPEDKLRMDLMYILRPGLMEDLRIIMATVKILFVPESTEGVAEGQTTAMKDSSRQDEQRKAASGS